jgi:hypothetical protein
MTNHRSKCLLKSVATFINAELPSGFNEPFGLRFVCLGFGFLFWRACFCHAAAYP